MPALIVAIIGLLFCWPAAIVGAIMGGSAKKKLRSAGSTDTGIATAAQVVGWIGGILGIIGTIIAILFVFVFGGLAANVANESNAAGAVADRFLANAAAGNVSGMMNDSAPGMNRNELEDVSDYLSSQIGSAVVSTNRTSTNIQTSGGTTQADLTIVVTGPAGSATADFNLVKIKGQYKVNSVNID